jgi:hypothetical protein
LHQRGRGGHSVSTRSFPKAWPDGDEVFAAAMINRHVHHAEILSLKGDSRTRTSGPPPAAGVTPALLGSGQTAGGEAGPRLQQKRSTWGR